MRNPLASVYKNLIDEAIVFFRYGLVGLANTGFSALLMILFKKIGFEYQMYTTLAYFMGMILSFTLNSLFTFKITGGNFFLRTVKFFLVSLSMLGITQIVQYVLIQRFMVPEIVGVVLGMITYTGGGYILNRVWVFSKGGK